MSAPVTIATEKPAYKPFECMVCHNRFTRHENLKRHASLHSQSPEENSVPCGLCSSTFSRQDLRQRHMKRKHPEVDESRITKTFSRGSTSSSGYPQIDDAIRRDQNVSSIEFNAGDSNDGSGATWIANDRHKQASDIYIPPQTRNRNDSASEISATDRSTGLDAPQDRMTMHQPWLSSTRYVDRFAEGVSDTEAQREHTSPSSTYHELGESIRSTGMAPVHPNNFSPTSNMLSPRTSNMTEGSPTGPSPNTLRFLDGWFPSPDQTTRGLELYFHHVSNFVPIIHPQMCEETVIPPLLMLSMLSLAYQYGEDPACDEEPGSGKVLALHCFHRARVLLYMEDEQAAETAYILALVQAYLLMEICAVMYLRGNDSAYGLQAHPKMIALARSGGVLQSNSNAAGTTQDLDSLWRQFIKAESRKRTAYAIHQFDAMLYQFLSIPRSLSHLEIKHDLPCSPEDWSAASSAEWAHRQLIASHSNKPMSYVDTVRLFLSPDPKLESLPIFDPYGAINIAQFLISSAREISGWTAMTGRISMERFEPLRSSLEALRPFIRAQAGTVSSTNVRVSEATWEIAMIELQMWSPSHTSGIVGGSFETVIREWTSISPWSETLFNASKAIQPHVNWYLQYLDMTIDVDFEPPWISLYAYKAYLIAWQLLRGGVKGAMQIVGVADENQEGAISWAKIVFGRRKSLETGRLILKSLDTLKNTDGVG